MTESNIKTQFSIKDLENLSGVKAHTIRIWEKRYNLFSPDRSDTNIRNYDIKDLQKLLNIALLNENGFKISKISEMSDKEIIEKIREQFLGTNDTEGHTKNAFKLAMLNFDQALFDATFNKLLTQHSFRDIFLNVIIDFLGEIGVLWQSNTITPAHEHFISNLIKQKLLINIERVQAIEKSKEKTYVLFLPMNEIHELGLLYIHFELNLRGFRSVYLGQSVPVENLIDLQNIFPNIEFVSYFTVQPDKENVGEYINELQNAILSKRSEKMHILGRNASEFKPNKQSENIKVYGKITDFLNSF